MKLTEETKNALFLLGMFLFLVMATFILFQDYMQDRATEKARIADLKGLAAWEQMKWDRETWPKVQVLLAEYEAHKTVNQQEWELKKAREGKTIIEVR